MTYVVNPWFFYLISIVDGLKNLFTVIAIIFGFFIVICIFIGAFGYDTHCFSEDEWKKFVKFIKIIAVSCVLCISLSILTPSKTTLYQMMIAKNITYENIEKTKKEGIKLVDYIIEKTEEYNKKEDGD